MAARIRCRYGAGGSMFHAAIQHARAADAAILDMLPRTKAKSLQSILMKLSKLADEAAAKAERAARRQAKREARRRSATASKAREDAARSAQRKKRV